MSAGQTLSKDSLRRLVEQATCDEPIVVRIEPISAPLRSAVDATLRLHKTADAEAASTLRRLIDDFAAQGSEDLWHEMLEVHGTAVALYASTLGADPRDLWSRTACPARLKEIIAAQLRYREHENGDDATTLCEGIEDLVADPDVSLWHTALELHAALLSSYAAAWHQDPVYLWANTLCLGGLGKVYAPAFGKVLVDVPSRALK